MGLLERSKSAVAENDSVSMDRTTVRKDQPPGGPSCQAYGCHHHYKPGLPCQCAPSCHQYNNCCNDYGPVCEHTNFQLAGVMTGYHQTAPEICNLIMSSNFKPGSSGWCGGAVYFATNPEAT